MPPITKVPIGIISHTQDPFVLLGQENLLKVNTANPVPVLLLPPAGAKSSNAKSFNPSDYMANMVDYIRENDLRIVVIESNLGSPGGKFNIPIQLVQQFPDVKMMGYSGTEVTAPTDFPPNFLGCAGKGSETALLRQAIKEVQDYSSGPDLPEVGTQKLPQKTGDEPALDTEEGLGDPSSFTGGGLGGTSIAQVTSQQTQNLPAGSGTDGDGEGGDDAGDGAK